MAEAESDEELAREGPQVSKSLRNALECPVCFEYMTPPIMMCESGHNVCWSCRPHLSSCPTCRQPLVEIRNFALENLSRELELPCRNSGEGCSEMRPVVDLTVHHNTCPFEITYGCPIECEWTGRRSEIREHMTKLHSDKILEGTEENGCRWELPLIVKDIRAIFAFGEVFRYRQRLFTLKKTFYIVVQYIGPRADASRFKYEVELCTSTGEQKVMVMGNATLGDHQDICAVYESGNCITLDYDLVKTVAHGKQLVYSIKVSKPIA